MYSIDSIFQFYHIAEFVKSICQAIVNVELSHYYQAIFLYTVINPLQNFITFFWNSWNEFPSDKYVYNWIIQFSSV